MGGIRGGTGNLAFYDGHVEAVVAQVKPASVMGKSESDPIVSFARAQNVGMACPKKPDWTKCPAGADFTAFHQFCQDEGVNYFFWLNKNKKNLSMNQN